MIVPILEMIDIVLEENSRLVAYVNISFGKIELPITFSVSGNFELIYGK